MSPILGIWASQISGHLWAPEGAYDALATVTLSATASEIIFTGIPSGYKHLQIRSIARSARSGVFIDGLYIQFNGDTGTNYSSHVIYGNGSAVASYSITNTSSPQSGAGIAGSTAGTNVFGASVIDVLDYANLNKYKTVRNLSGIENNGTGEIDFGSMSWRNTAPITSIRFFNESGTNFQVNTQFALYGVK